MEDGAYFEAFKLALPKTRTGHENRFHGLTYKGLRDDRTSLDLRTIRNVVVKQTRPEGNSAVFEIFSRLNTGGVNLTPQEIRASLYHSEFFSRVIAFNSKAAWRNVVGMPNPDPRMRDTEFLLRSLALANDPDGFSGSMANFINSYCLAAKRFDSDRIDETLGRLERFVSIFGDSESPFMRGRRFSGVLFESAFAAWEQLGEPSDRSMAIASSIVRVKMGEPFARTLQEGSTKPTNMRNRIGLLREAIQAVT